MASAASTPAHRLRELLARPQILTLPGACDALSARIADGVGVEAVCATGAGLADAAFGLGTVGLDSSRALEQRHSQAPPHQLRRER